MKGNALLSLGQIIIFRSVDQINTKIFLKKKIENKFQTFFISLSADTIRSDDHLLSSDKVRPLDLRK